MLWRNNRARLIIIKGINMNIIKLALILLLLIGFDVNAQSKLTKIEIDPMQLPTSKKSLSDLIMSIEYTPLQTKNDCLIGKVDLFDISKEYILVYCSKSVSVYLFRRDGRFITKIGRQGEGKGEYLQYCINGVFISEDQKQILIKTDYPNRILFYDPSGKFIKSQETKDLGGILRLYHNKYLFTYPNSKGEKPYTYEIRNRELKLLAQHIKTKPYKIKGAPNSSGMTWLPPACCYLYNNQLHVKEISLNDTVYRITDDNLFIPQYLISSGKYDITLEFRSDFKSFIDRMPEFVRLETVFETTSNLLLSYEYNKKRRYAFYDKQKCILQYFKSDIGIPNDYDGGIDFWPQKQINKEWVSFYDASVFEESIANPQKLISKAPKEMINKVKKMIRGLTSDDNPVMIVVKLK